MNRSKIFVYVFILIVVALVVVGIWQIRESTALRLHAVVRSPQRVMGTSCKLVAVVDASDVHNAQQALEEAEQAIRAVESKMSVWLENSEISVFNHAEAGIEIPLDESTLFVLRTSHDAFRDTDGAFDITCKPLIELWRDAADQNKIPSAEEIKQARLQSNWDLIELKESGVVKQKSSIQVDLGGVAKGFAIDCATEILKESGAAGGMVDIGGDLAVFGRTPDDDSWTVDIKDPFSEGCLGHIKVTNAAVCTSGNYARFTTINGMRFSHIIDPRTGKPADAVPSVTVVAKSAMAADIQATALSVLGSKGFYLIPEGFEVLMVEGKTEEHIIIVTPKFHELLLEPLKRNVGILDKTEYLDEP